MSALVYTGPELARWLERGERLREDSIDLRETDGAIGVVWALMCEAVQVARTWPAPPRSTLPSRSPGFDGRDEHDDWDRRRHAFLAGTTVTEMYGKPARPQFTAEQHRHADITLDLFQKHALLDALRTIETRKAVWAYALGTPPRIIRRDFGLSRFQISRAKTRAMGDMVRAIS